MLPVNFQIEEMIADFSAKAPSGSKGGGDPAVSFEDLMKRVGKVLDERGNAGETRNEGVVPVAAQQGQPEQARDVIQAVKRHLLSKGMDPQTVKLDKASLETLKDIFTKAGLEEEALTNLFDGLLADSTTGYVKLGDVFSAMAANADSLAAKQDSVLLASSTVPYIKTVLSRLGMDRETAGQVMDKAVGKNGEVDIRALVSALKDISGQATGGGIMAADGDKNAKQDMTALLSRIGIQSGDKGDRPVTLRSFIQGLENMMPEKASAEASRQQMAGALEQLMKSIESTGTAGAGVQDKADSPKINLLGESTIKNRIRAATSENAQKQTDAEGRVMPDAKDALKEGSQKGMKADAASAQKLFRETLAGDNNDRNFSNRLSDARGNNSAVAAGQMGSNVGQAGPGGASQAAAKPLPSYVMNQVGQQVVKAVQNNQNSVTIQLKPPQLGRLAISFETTGNTMKVSIVAEQSAARDILMSHTSDLKGAISEQHHGLRIDKVDVQLSQNFDQAMADARNGKENGSGSRRKGGVRPGPAGIVGAKAGDETAESDSHQRGGSGLLNLIA
ncbi:MAG: flagellar hook-length control protein FliK [Thermodesulfobacteriota bacterium]|nr:flagellar hook-length control protein FliK [Thermodesulfobacteriota bacterium]